MARASYAIKKWWNRAKVAIFVLVTTFIAVSLIFAQWWKYQMGMVLTNHLG
ncbi:MAG: hypothetical protein AAB364_02825 [Patescibacteria group bacterium]